MCHFQDDLGPVEIYEESTIGTEFTAPGGMSSLLDEDAPDGVVTALWAGTTCISR